VLVKGNGRKGQSTKIKHHCVSRERLGAGFDTEGAEAVDYMPVFVAGDGAGDEEIAAIFHVGEESLPGGLAQGLCCREDDEFRRAEFIDLAFGNDVAGLMQIVAKGADRILLSLELQTAENGKLRGLRGDDGDVWLLGILEVRRRGSRESCKVAKDGGFGLFGGVGV